jgi:hypothetical protein
MAPQIIKMTADGLIVIKERRKYGRNAETSRQII